MASSSSKSRGARKPVRALRASAAHPAVLEEYALFYDFKKIIFGAHIKGLREKSGLSLRKAAGQLNVPFSYLQRLETAGRAKKPALEFLERLATLYGVQVSELENAAGVRREPLADPLRLVHDQFQALVMQPDWSPAGMTEEWLESFSVRQKRQIIHMMRQLGDKVRDGGATPNEILNEARLLPGGEEE